MLKTLTDMKSGTANMIRTDIVFALTGDLFLNTRALKQIRALSSSGFDVHVLSLKGTAERIQLPRSVTVETIDLERRGGVRFFRAIDTAYGNAAARYHAGCYHASDLYALTAMSRAAATLGGRLTYDSRELYPYVAATVGRPWVRWYWKTVERRGIRQADAVFTVSGLIADRLVSLYTVERPVVVLNVPPRMQVIPSNRLRQMAELDETVSIILHLGQMRRDRGCETLVRAMSSVKDAHLIFLGYGPLKDRLTALVQDLDLDDRITFLDPVSPDEVPSVAVGADVGVTLLEDTCLNHRYALPNKLFEYMAAGVPILASDLPEIRSVVRGYDLGLTVDPSSSDAVADALSEITHSPDQRAHWRSNAAKAVETFNWESASQRFIDKMQSVMNA